MGGRRVVAGRDHQTVQYESLAAQPRETVAGLMEWLGLSFEEQQLNWVGHEHHDLAGNEMRFSDSAEIRFDTAWKTGLTRLQKLAIFWMTVPTRWAGRWLYELYPPLWELGKSRNGRTRSMAPGS